MWITATRWGGRARFGPGDVQWLTAGRGIVHSEMFALVHEDQPNPLDLLQIWLNLPADSKMQVPHFSMIWNEDLVWMAFTDADGRSTMVRAVAGSPPSPHRKTERPMQPSHSGASRPEADVAILQIKMQEHARWSLPPTMGERTRQMLYFFEGTSLCIAETPIRVGTAIELRRVLTHRDYQRPRPGGAPTAAGSPPWRADCSVRPVCDE